MEKKISREEFDQAVKATISEMLRDPEFEGTDGMLITMTGAVFISKVRKKLFGKENN